MATDTGDKFATHARAVAEQLLGEPNKNLSKGDELRFGNQGSISVDVKRGQFYDHQENEGGGVLWFIARSTGKTVDGGHAVNWLRDNGYYVEDDRPPMQQGKGSGDRPPPRLDADGNWIPNHVPDGARLTAAYDYADKDGKLAYQVVRYDWNDPASPKGHGKTFLQRRPDPQHEGRFRYKNQGAVPLPYRLPELIEDVAAGLCIFIVEGEKKVDMLRDIGVPATCNHGGAGKFPRELAQWLAGAEVVVIPDNDAAGRDHAQIVGANLKDIAKSVSILNLPELPPKGSVDDWIPAGGNAEELYRLRADKAEAYKPAAPQSKFNAVTWLDIPRPGAELKPLIKGILTQNEISLVVGESQSGKSFLAIELAMAVARGVPFFGHKSERGAVVYQAGESAAGVRRRRLPAYAQHNFCTNKDLPFVLLQSQIDLFGGDEHAHALAAEAVAWGAAMSQPLRLIVIDTFNRATPGANENDGRDMGAIIERCEYIRRETGAHVMLVHHLNAGGLKPRGHTSLFAAVDSSISVRKVDEVVDANGRQVREWSISKMKEGEDGITERFVLPQVVLGHDRDGDEITSCVVAAPLGDASGEDDSGSRVSGVNALVLRAIYDVVADKGTPAPAAMKLPNSVRIVMKTEISERLRSVMNDDSEPLEVKDGETEDDAKRRRTEANRKAAARARDQLFGKGIIQMTADHVWLTGKNVFGFPPPPGMSRRPRADPQQGDAQEDGPNPRDDLPFDLGDFQ
ncbi:AAA domain-containing protein [Loktanella atrilutea]|uniref:AAA domain-containing protein n=1 Tax=Loktanella atrilutea TaxID=366533 RepID=A0A1M4WB31_LOKAT|nr:helicase RepA family protein [Loktanella atrilutea]SHE78429.1 AAA domain-containing protein [Loktanella atrilutea]